MWRDGLWYKLHRMGCKGKMWRILREMYRKVKNKIVINDGEESDWYSWNEGVKEGSVLSPLLFSIFASDMEKEMKEQGIGAAWGREQQDWMGMLKFADDMVLVADSEEELEKMITVFWKYTRRWRILPHPDKTRVVVFGRDKTDKDEWKFGKYMIKRNNAYEYLGVWLDEDMTWKDHGEKLKKKMMKVKGWLGSMGVTEGLMKTSVARELWGILAYGAIEYGSEVWGMHCEGKRRQLQLKGWREQEKMRTKQELEARDDKWGLEIEQRKLMKDILKVGRQAASSFIERESGIYPLVYRRRSRMLKWWGKMVRKGEDRIIKRVYDQLLQEEGLKEEKAEEQEQSKGGMRRKRKIFNIKREEKTYQGVDRYKGWVWEVYETLKRWGLQEFWNDGKGGEIVMSEDKWKKKVNEKMKEVRKTDSDSRLLKMDKNKERTLDMYLMMVDDGKVHIKIMTQGREEKKRKGKILIRRMLTGTSKLEIDIGRWKQVQRKERKCKVCEKDQEDILHLLFECEEYEKERRELRRQWGEKLWEREMKVRGRKGTKEEGMTWFNKQIRKEGDNWRLTLDEMFVSMMGRSIVNEDEGLDLKCEDGKGMRTTVAETIEKIWKKRKRRLQEIEDRDASQEVKNN